MFLFNLAIDLALGNTTANASTGEFAVDVSEDQDGYLYCHGLQTTATESGLSDFGTFYPFTNMPRMFKYTAGQTPIFLGSPACKTIALIAFNKNGDLIRMGGHGWSMTDTLFDIGGKFNRPWATDLDGNTIEQSLSAIDDTYSKAIGEPPYSITDTYPAKIPCVTVPPDTTGMKFHWWNWPVYDAIGDRAKIYLSMDNGGVGFDAPTGSCLFVFVNKEVCRTLIDRLIANKSRYDESFQDQIDSLLEDYGAVGGSTKWNELAAQYDAITCGAVLLEESAEQSLIDARIEANRKGTVTVTINDASGHRATCPMTAKATQSQFGREFTFGVFPGTNGSAISAGYISALKDLMFGYATFLFSWFWFSYVSNYWWSETKVPAEWGLLHPTQADWVYDEINEPKIKEVWGFDSFKTAGFDVKAHAVCYNQTYQIPPYWYLPTTGYIPGWYMDPPTNSEPMPNYGNGKSKAESCSDLVAWGTTVMDAFGSSVNIVEVINEAAYTNVLALNDSEKQALTTATTNSLDTYGKPLLVNSASTTIQWWEYFLWNIAGAMTSDCTPENYGIMPTTYRQYLDAISAGTMAKIDIIGIQWYPGSFVNWGQWLGYASVFEGSGHPPAEIYRELERYASYGKTLHITEFSVPSEEEVETAPWKCGYWVENWDAEHDTPMWTPDAWADYVALCYRYAFSHPLCKSITYWDPVDAGSGFNPANTNGGLMTSALVNKSAADRVKDLISGWTTETSPSVSNGVVSIEGYGGTYELELTFSTGRKETFTVTISERQNTTSTITLKGSTAPITSYLRRLCFPGIGGKR